MRKVYVIGTCDTKGDEPRFACACLARAGAKPLPGHADMFMPFEFTSGSRDGGTTMTVRPSNGAPQTFTGAAQIQALSFSDDGSVDAPVVFAGYGLVVASGVVGA